MQDHFPAAFWHFLCTKLIEWLSISIFLNTSVEADFIGPGAIFLNIAQSVVVIASSVSYPNIGQSYSPFRGRVL